MQTKSTYRLCSLAIILLLTACMGSEGSGPEQTEKDPASKSNKIVNLYDAFGRATGKAVLDFGFSALIEYNGKTILFDAGTNANVFKQNVEALGVDLRTVDIAIASHSHSDHISGFDYLIEVNPDVQIYLPRDFFGLGAPIAFNVAGTEPEKTQSLPKDRQYYHGEKTDLVIEPSGRFWRGKVQYVTDNTTLAEGIRLIATSSPFLGYFSKYPNLSMQGDPSDSEATFIGLPELSLALDSEAGQVIIVGCSHSTVEAIVKEAKQYVSRDVDLLMGGYHLIPYKTDELERMAGRLRVELGVKRVAPAHCTGHLAFRILEETFVDGYVAAGLGAEIPF